MQFFQLFWKAAICNAACGEANRSVTLLQKLLILETKSLGDKHFYSQISRIFWVYPGTKGFGNVKGREELLIRVIRNKSGEKV
jgi:hypothetical protein